MVWRWVRWVPFVVVAALSVWAAGRAPDGRRAPEFDWTLTWSAAVQALGKRPHVVSTLLLFLLAVLAVGVTRCGRAAALTVAVGVLWELAETTAAGQHPRLADLLPDLLGAGLGWALVAAVAAAVTRAGRGPRGGSPRRPDAPAAGP